MSLIAEPESAEFDVLVIPMYNCAPQIGGLIKSLAKVVGKWDEVWFIDNGSTDGTIDVTHKHLKKYLRNTNSIRVYLNSENIGLGGTHKIAFQRAMASNFKTLTIFHGDHQANLQDARRALEFAKKNPDVFVLGSRFSRGSKLVGYSRLRTLFNHSMNVFYSIFLKHKVSDLGSGLNIFPLLQLKKLDMDKLPNDLTFNIELLKWLVLNKKVIFWYPISWTEEEQISNVKVIQQIFKTFALAVIPYGKMGTRINPSFKQNEVR